MSETGSEALFTTWPIFTVQQPCAGVSGTARITWVWNGQISPDRERVVCTQTLVYTLLERERERRIGWTWAGRWNGIKRWGAGKRERGEKGWMKWSRGKHSSDGVQWDRERESERFGGGRVVSVHWTQSQYPLSSARLGFLTAEKKEGRIHVPRREREGKMKGWICSWMNCASMLITTANTYSC